jgi:adenosine deaminase CECR1
MASTGKEDIEAWAQAEGVPSLSDPFIQKYLSGRDALVEQEKKQRSGWWPAASKSEDPNP